MDDSRHIRGDGPGEGQAAGPGTRPGDGGWFCGRQRWAGGPAGLVFVALYQIVESLYNISKLWIKDNHEVFIIRPVKNSINF